MQTARIIIPRDRHQFPLFIPCLSDSQLFPPSASTTYHDVSEFLTKPLLWHPELAGWAEQSKAFWRARWRWDFSMRAWCRAVGGRRLA